METVDSNKLFDSNLNVSLIFKLEVAFVFLFFADLSIEGAFVLAVVCAMINGLTERIYLKKKTQGQKLILLFKSLLILLCLCLVGYIVFAHFPEILKRGYTKVVFYKLKLLMELLAFEGSFLGILRLIAGEIDWLLNRYRQKKSLGEIMPNQQK